MGRLPRVEITEQGLKALKIETAISGGSQKDTLEHLILQGISSRALAALGEAEHVPQVDKKISAPLVENAPPMECQKVGEAIVCTARTVTPEARKALEFIREALQAGQEPVMADIAEKLEITTVALGRMLNPLGLQAKNTHKNGAAVRIYTRPMKARIEAILSPQESP